MTLLTLFYAYVGKLYEEMLYSLEYESNLGVRLCT
jgi:hypothetical protein